MLNHVLHIALQHILNYAVQYLYYSYPPLPTPHSPGAPHLARQHLQLTERPLG